MMMIRSGVTGGVATRRMLVPVRAGVLLLAVTGAALFASSKEAEAQSGIVGWGDLVVNSAWSQEPYVEVAAGYDHSLARRSDGSVVAWGYNNRGQCNVPALPPGLTYVELSAGFGHSLARRSDGSVVAWGYNGFGQCDVPALPPGLSYVEVAGGAFHSLARRSDGSVVAWGDNYGGKCNVPALPPGLAYVELSAGFEHSLARRSDGSVVAWGINNYGQCSVPALPPGLTYVDVVAGSWHSLARRSDGSVVGWGKNDYGQCNVPALPSGLTYVELAAGFEHSLARYEATGSAGTPFCFGDGVAPHTPCPCTNDNDGSPGGCDWGDSAFPGGAPVTATGSASMAAADTYLSATAVANDFGLFFGAANQVNGGNGSPLNDGLRCAGGSLVRLTPPTLAAGNLTTTPSPVQTLDTGAAAGVTRRYQYWFRTPGGPCGQMANLTNGFEILWEP